VSPSLGSSGVRRQTSAWRATHAPRSHSSSGPCLSTVLCSVVETGIAATRPSAPHAGRRGHGSFFERLFAASTALARLYLDLLNTAALLINTPFALNAPVVLVKAVSEPSAENSAFHLPAHHTSWASTPS
jgi:hypothetical protein